jgi:uncharacterized membrane protein
MSWISQHAHAIIAVVGAVGLTASAIAANTAGLLPASAGAWFTAVGGVIAYVVAHVVVPPVAAKMSARFKR